MGALAGCVLVVMIALLGLTALAAAFSGARRERGPGEDDAGGGGGGGSVRRMPPGRPPEPPGADPEWWPSFEREFAAYVRQRTGVA
jgi:hypothetical protein